MDTIILLVLCVCGGILAASQQKTYNDDEILTGIRQSLREELKAEIQELMEHNKALQDEELSQSHNMLVEEITSLRNEMDMLKTEVTSLKRDLGEKTKKLVTLQDDTDTMNIQMNGLEDDLAITRKDVHKLKEEMMAERNINYGQVKQHDDRRTITTEPEDGTENVAQSTKAASGVVAFSASRTTDVGPVIVDTTITYDKLELSIGGGFVPSTGIFTVPITGLYLLHMGGQGDNVELDYFINQDQYRIVRTGTAPAYGTAATVAIVQLTVGDMVRVELDAGFGSAYLQCGTSGPCHMGGFLLYQTI